MTFSLERTPHLFPTECARLGSKASTELSVSTELQTLVYGTWKFIWVFIGPSPIVCLLLRKIAFYECIGVADASTSSCGFVDTHHTLFSTF